MATPDSRQLLASLENLVDERFKRFKWYLNQPVLDGCKPIKICHLENSDRQDVVDKMKQAYGLDAQKLMETILTMMKQEAAQKNSDLKIKCQTDLKSYLTVKFGSVDEGIHDGAEKKLEAFYTPLYIRKVVGDLSDEHETLQIQMASKRSAELETTIDCNELFLTDQEEPILTVLTKGVAGIGKTVSMKKFIHDWIEGKANENIEFVFPFLFRDLSLKRKDKFSLIGLLKTFFKELKGMEPPEYLDNVLFILDGLDEFQPQLDFKEKSICRNIDEEISLDQLLMNLIGRDLLPKARLWITSRPAAANQIPRRCVDRLTEVCGFSDEQIVTYFKKNISDGKIAQSVIEHVQSIQSLHTMCKIPVFSWISAQVLKRLYSTKNAEIPRTLTQMYIHFLDFQTKREHLDLKSHWKIFEKLGKLAFEQLKENKLVFEEEDLTKYGIAVEDVSGVCSDKIMKAECGIGEVRLYEFVHFSVQEFFAALYVFLSFHNNNTNVLVQGFTFRQRPSVYESAIDQALRSENGKFDLFVRFLLGLSLESNQKLKLLACQLKQQGNNPQLTEKTVKYIKEQIRLNQNPERCINLFHCLNELNHSSIEKDIKSYLTSGKLAEAELAQVKPSGWFSGWFSGWRATTVPENPDEPVLKIELEQLSALAFILLTSNEQLDEFDLREYSGISEEGLLRLMPVVKASRRAVLIHLADKGCSELASVLKSKACALRDLDLSNNDLQPSRLENLTDGLTNEHCKLERLTLTKCQIKSCDSLALMLSSTTSNLRGLDLSWNEIGDSGVQQLCTGLKSPNCKLETLELRGCDITETGCGYLKSALVKPSCLTELDLTRNEIGESGANMLLDLKDKQDDCSLQRLRVDPFNVMNSSLDPVPTSPPQQMPPAPTPDEVPPPASGPVPHRGLGWPRKNIQSETTPLSHH